MILFSKEGKQEEGNDPPEVTPENQGKTFFVRMEGSVNHIITLAVSDENKRREKKRKKEKGGLNWAAIHQKEKELFGPDGRRGQCLLTCGETLDERKGGTEERTCGGEEKETAPGKLSCCSLRLGTNVEGREGRENHQENHK